jgi:hypothetical protein
MPYYAKAFLAQSHHFIGDSILSGNSVSAPAVSWNSAVDYFIAYSKAIWQAILLGLVGFGHQGASADSVGKRGAW